MQKPFELIVFLKGIEPSSSDRKSDVLTTWLQEHILVPIDGLEPPAFHVSGDCANHCATSEYLLIKICIPRRVRTFFFHCYFLIDWFRDIKEIWFHKVPVDGWIIFGSCKQIQYNLLIINILKFKIFTFFQNKIQNILLLLNKTCL